jgi:hypothetical protein
MMMEQLSSLLVALVMLSRLTGCRRQKAEACID